MKYCETFAEWEESAKMVVPSEMFGFMSRGDRSFYKMRGHNVVEEVFFPWAPRKDPVVAVFMSDLCILPDHPLAKLARRCGGEWTDEGWYSKEGRGGLKFPDCEHCWNFIVRAENEKLFRKKNKEKP